MHGKQWARCTNVYVNNIHLSSGLMNRHRLTENQLNCEIRDDDITLLAKHFDKIELYPNLMNLNSAEKDDVLITLHRNGSQMAMIKCLSLWKGRDSFKATYTALLEILLRLEKGEIANNVCLYLAKKNGKITMIILAYNYTL